MSLRADNEQQEQASELSELFVVQIETEAPSPLTEQCIDPNQAEWKKIKKEWRFLGPIYAVFKYFKKRLDARDAQLDEQKKQIAILFAGQDRQDHMIKHMQQTFVEQNRFSGG